MARTVLVVGLGTFGLQAAKALYQGGATVIAIDVDSKAVEAAQDSVTQAVCVDVNNESALEAAGAFDVDVVVLALRHYFATSVLATHMFKTRGVKDIVAHVDSNREAAAVRAIGATTAVFPERDMALRVAQQLLNPGLGEQIPVGGDMVMIDLTCTAFSAGKTLEELQIGHIKGLAVVAIRSKPDKPGKEEKVALTPPPDTVVNPGDILIVIGTGKALEQLGKVLGSDAPQETDPDTA